MTINIIASKAHNNVIGCKGQIPWNLPLDREYFNKIIHNYPVVMGRITYQSIGKPLKDRRNIVVSKTLDSPQEGIDIYPTIEDALYNLYESQNIFIIGGQSIYEQTLPIASKMFITYIHANIQGDRYFPLINHSNWKKTSEILNKSDEYNPYDFSFVVYERINIPDNFIQPVE